VEQAGLPVSFSAPVTDHGASDDAGTGTLGEEAESFWRDHKGAGVNAIRTQTMIRDADVVVVRFGDKYRQWNAAFDAGFAAALDKPVITLHDEELDHALKEVDRAAQATARTAEQVVDVLRYVIAGRLPG
jgi:YtoQ family protein